jgi:hypothetical protein
MAESPLALGCGSQPGSDVASTQTIHQATSASSQKGFTAHGSRDATVVLLRELPGTARSSQYKPRRQRRALRSSRTFEPFLRAQHVGTSSCILRLALLTAGSEPAKVFRPALARPIAMSAPTTQRSWRTRHQQAHDDRAKNDTSRRRVDPAIRQLPYGPRGPTANAARAVWLLVQLP